MLLFHADFLLGLIFDPEAGCIIFLWNVNHTTRRYIPEDGAVVTTGVRTLNLT
jgi:hypothetical protein